MSSMNFRTAILYGIGCLSACSMSVSAQEIDIDLSSSGGAGTALVADGVDDNPDLFTATLNPDGVSNSNVLINPVTIAVAESPGLELTIVSATATSGIDNFNGDNRAEFNISGLGLAIRTEPLRDNPAVSTALGFNIPSSQFRLDASHDEFLTIAFNQDVIVSGIGVGNFDDGETFTFGSAVDITNQNVTLGGLSGGVDLLTFDAPLEFAAGEEILVGNTGFDPTTFGVGTTGVSFERIILEVVGGPGGGGNPAIPEPSSLAVLSLGGLLIAARRRR